MHLEREIRECGCFQIASFFISGLTGVISGLQLMVLVFIATTPRNRCRLPDIDPPRSSNYESQWPGANESYRGASFNGSLGFSQNDGYILNQLYRTTDGKFYCRYCPSQVDDFVEAVVLESETAKTTQNQVKKCAGNDSISCPEGSIYDTSMFENSLVTKFNMICGDEAWMANFVQSSNMFGCLLGSFLVGNAADRVGRRKALIVSSSIGVVAYIGRVFANNFVLLCCLEVVNGACCFGATMPAFVIFTEFVGPKYRTIPAVLFQLNFTFGYSLAGVISYFVRDWQSIQTLVTIPTLVMVPMFFILPESVLWLASQNQTNKVHQVIRYIQRFNCMDTTKPIEIRLTADAISPQASSDGVPTAIAGETSPCPNVLGDPALVTLTRTKAKPVEPAPRPIRDLFSHPTMTRYTFIVFFMWFSVSLYYFGTSLNPAIIPGNVFVTYQILAAMDIPGVVCTSIVMSRFGRKSTMITLYAVGGVCLIVSSLLPSSVAWLIVATTSVAKACGAGIFSAAYQWSAEIFPTPSRNTGIGLSSCSGRLASILSPQIALLGSYVAPWVPFLIYGFIGELCAVALLFLPETAGRTLPQTVAESVALSQKPYYLPPQQTMSTTEFRNQMEVEPHDDEPIDITQAANQGPTIPMSDVLANGTETDSPIRIASVKFQIDT